VERETGFDDIFDSQATFRALLDALSRPGTIRRLPARPYASAPQGFCAPALTILKTMCDHRVSFSIGSSSRRPDLVSYLTMNLSTPFEEVEKADYVLFEGERFDPDFANLNHGTLEFPEFSATALLCVRRLSDGGQIALPGSSLRFRGPGVKGTASLRAAGLDARYLEERSRANQFYPMGIDLFLVDADGRVAGIPRVSVVEQA